MEEQPRREIGPKEAFNRALYSYIKDLTTPDPNTERETFEDEPEVITKNKYGQDLEIYTSGDVIACRQDINSSNGIEYVSFWHTKKDNSYEINIAFDDNNPYNIIQILSKDHNPKYHARQNINYKVNNLGQTEVDYTDFDNQDFLSKIYIEYLQQTHHQVSQSTDLSE